MQELVDLVRLQHLIPQDKEPFYGFIEVICFGNDSCLSKAWLVNK